MTAGDDVRELRERLSEAGLEAREVLEACREAVPGRTTFDTPLERLVQGVATELTVPARTPLATAPRETGRGSMLQRRVLGVLAALLIAASFVWQVLETPDRARLERLEQERIAAEDLGLRLTYPRRDEVTAWTRFRWYSRPLEGGSYSLELWDADRDTVPLVALGELVEREWRPEIELPDRVRLRLRAWSEDGELLDTFETTITKAR